MTSLHGMELERGLEKVLKERLSYSPAVALLGPRQVGKTTLAFKIVRERERLYLDLESPHDRDKLNDPVFPIFPDTKTSLSFLDEVQRMPELFATLRGLIGTEAIGIREMVSLLT